VKEMSFKSGVKGQECDGESEGGDCDDMMYAR